VKPIFLKFVGMYAFDNTLVFCNKLYDAISNGVFEATVLRCLRVLVTRCKEGSQSVMGHIWKCETYYVEIAGIGAAARYIFVVIDATAEIKKKGV